MKGSAPTNEVASGVRDRRQANQGSVWEDAPRRIDLDLSMAYHRGDERGSERGLQGSALPHDQLANRQITGQAA